MDREQASGAAGARPTDIELLALWRQGDRRSAERLIRRHFALVHRFFASKHHADADEYAQRTFVACLDSAHRWRGAGTFRSYLLGIARMTLLHGLRGERRRQSRFEPLLDGLELVPASVSRSPTSRVAGTERAAHVASALRRIPLDHQLALELFYWEDLSMEEIAVALGIATGTVKSRLARAREYLRAQLAVAASVDMGAAMRTAQPP